ncbi:MAG TPA: hypothetical protein VNF04_18205, partial [Stellaceae bacterium]|nr:hypothetical protein [Stellaceae bacterium]
MTAMVEMARMAQCPRDNDGDRVAPRRTGSLYCDPASPLWQSYGKIVDMLGPPKAVADAFAPVRPNSAMIFRPLPIRGADRLTAARRAPTIVRLRDHRPGGWRPIMANDAATATASSSERADALEHEMMQG